MSMPRTEFLIPLFLQLLLSVSPIFLSGNTIHLVVQAKTLNMLDGSLFFVFLVQLINMFSKLESQHSPYTSLLQSTCISHLGDLVIASQTIPLDQPCLLQFVLQVTTSRIYVYDSFMFQRSDQLVLDYTGIMMEEGLKSSSL